MHAACCKGLTVSCAKVALKVACEAICSTRSCPPEPATALQLPALACICLWMSNSAGSVRGQCSSMTSLTRPLLLAVPELVLGRPSARISRRSPAKKELQPVGSAVQYGMKGFRQQQREPVIPAIPARAQRRRYSLIVSLLERTA